MAEPSHRFSGLVLAGGRSSRMGCDKGLLALESGQMLLDRAIAALREAGAAEILVSVGGGRTYGRADTVEVADVVADCGPIGGLAAGLAAAREGRCAVLAVDMPAVTAEYLGKLIGLARDFRGIVPMINGSAEPLAAVYPSEAGLMAAEAIKTGEYGLQRWVRRLGEGGLVDFYEVPEAERAFFANWNRPEDRTPGRSD